MGSGEAGAYDDSSLRVWEGLSGWGVDFLVQDIQRKPCLCSESREVSWPQ